MNRLMIQVMNSCFRSLQRIFGVIALLFIGSTAWPEDGAPAFDEAERRKIFSLSPPERPIADSTNAVDGNPLAIQLGQILFSDTRLSGSGKFSCKSCHDPDKGWADGRQVAAASGAGTRNTPSLWNVAHNRWFFWDGRADSLWSQALKPIENPRELAGSRLQSVRIVSGDALLQDLYGKLFGTIPDFSDTERFPAQGGPLTEDFEGLNSWWRMNADDRQAVTRAFVNIGKAIAAFEATIISGDTPFDHFVADLLKGKQGSRHLSTSAQEGLKIFVGKGNCVVCHSGPYFSNKEFHDVRVPQLPGIPHDEGRVFGVPRIFEDEFVAPGEFSDDKEGPRASKLFYLGNQEMFHGQFKTPSLRNVAATAPYMHQGQFATLRDVVKHYSTLENAADITHTTHVENLIIPLGLSDHEIDDLVAFLESLSPAASDYLSPR